MMGDHQRRRRRRIVSATWTERLYDVFELKWMYNAFQANAKMTTTMPPSRHILSSLHSDVLTQPSFSFCSFPFWLHSGGSSIPFSSSLSPSSFVLCTVVGLCSAGLYTVYNSRGVGPVLTNWCFVPAGTMTKSPALTSCSLPPT
jgi:hypothetical protein